MKKVIKFCVYIHIFPNGKKYVGITSRKPEVRWGCNGFNYRGQRIKSAIEKYGWNNIEHYILESNISKSKAEKLEIKLIKAHRSNEKEFGYNSSTGGNVGCLGYKHTEEEIQKIKDSLKTTYPNRGRKASDEERKRLSIAHLGQVAWNKGMKGCFTKTKEEIEKRLKTIKERYPDYHFKPIPIHYVLQMDLDNNIIKVWDNVNSAERELKIKNIWKCCNFKCQTSKGFKFRYAEDFDKQYRYNP